MSSQVGARRMGLGALQLPVVQAFAEDVDNVLFEADEDCVAAVEEWWQANGECATTVLAHGLWSEDGEVDFHVNRRPHTSSVYPLNDRFRGYYFASRRNDLVLGEMAETVETRRLRVRSLDSLVAAGEAPCPDLLGLDAQGSEFEILTGAAECIRTRTVVVVTEFAFDEVYRGQKTFVDVHALMLDWGFTIARIITQRYASFRGPPDARARTEPLFGDALYLPRVDAVPDRDPAVALYKLAAIAAALGHVEYALSALARADEQADAPLRSALGERRYFRFLRTLDETLARTGRSSPSSAPGRGLRSLPGPRALLRPRGHSAVERVFLDQGLDDVAARIRKHRVQRGS